MTFPDWMRKQRPPAETRRQLALQRPGLFLPVGAALFVLALIAGIYLFFPAETLKQRVIQELATRTRGDVQIGQLKLFPLLTLDLRRLSVATTGLPQALVIDHLTVSPRWLSLLSANPAMQVKTRLLNGSVTADFSKNGTFNARGAGLRFDLPIQQPLPFSITATLDDASLDSALRLDQETSTQLSLRLLDAMVHGLTALDAGNQGLALGEIILQADGQGRTLLIKSVSARGGVLEVDGAGSVLIGRTAATSRINLTLQVRPGPNATAEITALLELAGKPAADGHYPLRLNGTLTKPVLTPAG